MPHGYLAIGTQLLSRPAAQEPGHPWHEHVPPPGRDATLLAVVPIPGTQTSLAIVAYAISTSGTPEPAPTAHQAANPAAGQSDLLAKPASGLLVDHVQRRVWVDGAEVVLTFREFELLAFLSAHPATVFSRVDLVHHVWPDATGATDTPGTPDTPATPDRRNVRRDSRTVDVHVSRLRRKLGPVHGRCLVTEHRAGYQFRPHAAAAL
ncbi:MAG: winged helix-turn-helix domain-containing protein [Streptosporangiaceae bacterium]